MDLGRNIKCILFDLDNTLIDIPDPWTYFDSIIIEVMRDDLGLPVPESAVRDTLWRTGKEYIAILQSWGVEDPNGFWELFDCRDEYERRALIETDQLIIQPDIWPTIRALKSRHYQLGIITNSPSQIALMELEAYSMAEEFEIIVGLGETQDICKPEPDGILMALEKLGFESSEVVFVGDSTIDLVAAKRANVAAILLDRSGIKQIHNEELTDADYLVITSLDQLPLLLE